MDAGTTIPMISAAVAILVAVVGGVWRLSGQIGALKLELSELRGQLSAATKLELDVGRATEARSVIRRELSEVRDRVLRLETTCESCRHRGSPVPIRRAGES